MPTCHVPLLASSNRPLFTSMFKASFQPVVPCARTGKCRKRNMQVKNWFFSSVHCIFSALFMCVRCFFRLLIYIANPVCVECDRLTLCALNVTGWKPAFILLLCHTSRHFVGGRGRVCSSVQLSVWTRVGQSAQLLGIVTRLILAASFRSPRPCITAVMLYSIWCRSAFAVTYILSATPYRLSILSHGCIFTCLLSVISV